MCFLADACAMSGHRLVECFGKYMVPNWAGHGLRGEVTTEKPSYSSPQAKELPWKQCPLTSLGYHAQGHTLVAWNSRNILLVLEPGALTSMGPLVALREKPPMPPSRLQGSRQPSDSPAGRCLAVICSVCASPSLPCILSNQCVKK